MKKLYQIILTTGLLSATLQASAQFSGDSQNKSSSTGLTTNTIVTAEQSITLLPGFQTNGYDFTASINAVSADCVPLASVLSADQNYIVTFTPREAFQDVAGLPAKSTCEVMQQVQYFDGLGRLIQIVQIKGNPDATKDVVTPAAYDQFGREARKYLPYAAEGTANGSYKSNALTSGDGIFKFYNPSPGGSSGTQMTNGIVRIPEPFAETGFEPSPLNRVVEQGAPGDVWQLSSSGVSGNGHTVKTGYGTNGSDEVRLWTISGTTCSSTASYGVNQLYKTTTKDENWISGKSGTTEEFKDKEGRVVLKRTWESESSSLSTYYVYDDYGNLRYVIPPGVTASNFSESASDAQFNGYIYAYHYDYRNRLIEKKLPGKGWEYMVYNKLDQVVMSQDANQRNHANQEWTITKYDGLGRVVLTGIYTHSGSTANTSYRSAMQTSVDNQTTQWENPVSTGNGYTSNTYPSSWTTTLTINYYDDYSFPGNPYPYTGSSKTKGLLTASRVKVLNGTTGTTDMLWMVNYYDDYGRVTKSYQQHYAGGTVSTGNYDEISNTWSFTNELKTVNRIHHKPGAADLPVNTTYSYDHMGRKLTTTEQINGGSVVTLSQNTYNEIGQLREKELHNGMQSTNYTYNERGWLKSSNSNEFSERLKYNDGTTPQYNGNIANQEWGAGASFPNVFTYNYDKLNRLTSGGSTGIVMSEVLSYDKMGNVSNLNRDGSGANQYHYTGNQLTSVDNVTGTYFYDANGNVVTDGRNGMGLTYNLLNLPQTATKSGVSLSYTYDAFGNKLAKVSTLSGVTSHRYYAGGIEYDDNGIDIIHTVEGVARNNAGNYSYEYNLSDHLGNVRYSFYRNPTTGNLQRIQADDYYPFGKRRVVTLGSNKYLYNGKEIQDELGEQYDYGARFYDPVIGRFTTVDKLAEHPQQIDTSPYAYTGNNPVNRIDPDGNCWPCIVEGAIALYESLTAAEVATAAVVTTGTTIVVTNNARSYLNRDHSVAVQDNTSVVNSKPVSLPKGSEGNPHETSRAARRDAMRKEGIPTSQPLIPDKATKSKDKVYTDRDKEKTVQDAKNDRSHEGKPHWEAGKTKKDENAPDGLNRSGNNNKPQMQNGEKKKSYYNP